MTPEDITANNRGVGLMGKFEYEQARQIFEGLTARHQSSTDIKVNLAIATLNRQNDGDEAVAIRMLGEVLSADPNHVRAHYCTGLLKLYLESPQEALAHFEIATTADPKDAFAAYYAGQCLAQSDQHEKAIEWFTKVIALDANLRSAYYAASQSLLRTGKQAEGERMLAEFQRLEKSPQARLAKFQYTRMGPKGNAQVIDLPAVGTAAEVVESQPASQGPVFNDPEPLLADGDKYTWLVHNPDRPVSITACDIEMDGDIDVFIANVLDEPDGARNAVCINDGTGHFTLAVDHVLASGPDVNAALWGDYDNDGLTDVYLCRKGANMLWRQVKAKSWQDVTETTGTANGSFNTVDGAMFDADHDGDLDIFCVNADGPNELFNNNLDGTFRPIAQEAGIAGAGKGSRQVLPVDLDNDRDLDIIVINNQPPHDVWMNERAWKYTASPLFDRFRAWSGGSILAFDADVDGQVELHTFNLLWGENTWQPAADGDWQSSIDETRPLLGAGTARESDRQAVLDPIGDGVPGVMLTGGHGLRCLRASYPRGAYPGLELIGQSQRHWGPVLLEPKGGSAIVAAQASGGPVIYRPSANRYPFTSLTFSGRKDNDTMRSNASGIGTHYAARMDSTWVTGTVMKDSSGPGQSLQPVTIGLGTNKQIDFVAIDWSDGVFQTEIDLAPGPLHTIAETQRQLSSCPVIFAWDGEQYRFITDALGVGGLGYLVAPGEYAPPRPWERVLLPEGAVVPRNDRFAIKLAEPMEEACYLDATRLKAYDLPPGWSMSLDERMGINDPQPTGEPVFYRTGIVSARVTNDRGEDVTAALDEADLVAAPEGEVDTRFIGLLKGEHQLVMDFDQPLDRASVEGPSPLTPLPEGEGKRIVLLADGWVEYPYSQTMFAAWQAGAAYRAPTIEARDADGHWHILLKEFGYPAGMPREMSVPLANLPNGTTALRITSNMEIYWDRIRIAIAEDCPEARVTELNLASAAVRQSGFAKRSTGPQKQPHYDYTNRAGLWDTRHQSGLYTAFGEAAELISTTDSAVAIFGPGEEVHAEFDAALPPLPEGWTRRFVLELDGWCRDMDLHTKDGETIEPLPVRETDAADAAAMERRNAQHRRFNTRYEGGR